MLQKAILSFMVIIALAHGARAGSFDRRNLEAVAARIEEEKRPGVEPLQKHYRDLISILYSAYSRRADLDASDETKLRALVETFSDNGVLMPLFTVQEGYTTPKEQRDLFFRELGKYTAAQIKASTRPVLPPTDPSYRDQAIRGETSDPRVARHALIFASALIAQISNVRFHNMPERYTLFPMLAATVPATLGFIFTLNHSISWSLALPVDAVALAFGAALLPRIGIRDWYRNRVARLGAVSFLATFLPSTEQFARPLAKGDITALLNHLCQTQLEPATALPVRVAADAPEEEEVAAEAETQAVGRRRL